MSWAGKATAWDCLSYGVIPTNWEENLILNLYKGKSEAIDHGNYHSLKLRNQVMKLLERVLDFYVCEMVNLNDMQFSFEPGRGTTDTISIVLVLQEKYIVANKRLYFSFILLKGSPWPCAEEGPMVDLEEPCIKEWAMHVIYDMHQACVISPLSLILMLGELSLLYTDDLVLITDTKEGCISAKCIESWKGK